VHGRDYIAPEDVKAVAHAALDHRISIKPELWMSELTGPSVVEAVLHEVPVPSARGTRVTSGPTEAGPPADER
jgi:MoxR-like ATPase